MVWEMLHNWYWMPSLLPLPAAAAKDIHRAAADLMSLLQRAQDRLNAFSDCTRVVSF